jgi:uncharacterized delta-60 repeat protein
LDTTFDTDGKVTTNVENSGTGSDDVAYDIFTTADRLTVAGSSTLGSSKSLSVVRYNPNGSLDESFDSDGAKRILWSSESSPYASLILQPDGALIIGGRKGTLGDDGKMELIRCLPDGSEDLSFDQDGHLQIPIGRSDDHGMASAFQPDGRTLVAGNVSLGTGYCIAVARYNAVGALDRSFAQGGIVKYCLDLDGRPGAQPVPRVSKLLLQPDGKFLVVGHLASFPLGPPATDFLLVRFNPDGSLDTTFGNGGKVTTDFFGRNDVARSAVLQPDGRIVVVGYGTTTNENKRIAVARYQNDGSLDLTFNSTGYLLIGLNGIINQEAADMALQPDGKVLLAGQVDSNLAVFRLNIDGSLDLTFNSIGYFRAIGNPGASIGLQPDGKIVVSTASYTNTSDFDITRLTQSGTLDNSFGNNGWTFTSIGGGDSPVRMAVQQNGKLIVTGFTVSSNATYDTVVVRYGQDSALDPTFGNGGIIVSDLSPTKNDAPSDVLIRRDGKILVSGYSETPGLPGVSDFSLTQYLGDEQNLRRTPFDFDGRTDIGIFRPGSSAEWWLSTSSNNGVLAAQFGGAGDQPVPADYDGDGKADIGVYRPNGGSGGEWWIQRSAAGLLAASFGSAEDKAAVGDYTGDGKADCAFFRPSTGTWFVLRSEDLSFYGFPFGVGTDVPAPGDYDGDGKTDAAVFRNGAWYVNKSSGGVTSLTFGSNGDLPVPGSYVR